MSPIKKLIDKFTGQEERASECGKLRGYGKLPVSREFFHIETYLGPAKVFQEWIQAGHETWITRSTPEKRGEIAPSYILAGFDEIGQRAIAACIWSSQDCASPPRAFPFTLYAIQPHEPAEDCLHVLMACDHCWSQLKPLFDPAHRGELDLQDLRSTRLNPIEDGTRPMNEVREQCSQIVFRDWLTSISTGVQTSEPLEYLQLVQARSQAWREREPDAGFAVRLPLSRGFGYLPQIAAWLRWLSTHVGESCLRLRALFAPHEVPESEPTLTLMTRGLTPEDFQLLTTNAHEYDRVEDLTRAGAARALGDPEPMPADPRLVALLEDAGLTLWDWAGRRL